MKIKIFSIDIDGTLISDSKYYPEDISESCIEKLRFFCSKGGKFILSTGREPGEAIKVFNYLVSKGFNSKDIPFIVSLNGSTILKTDESFKIVSNKIFDEFLCKKIVDFLHNSKFNFFLINSKNEYFSKFSFISFCIWFYLYRKKNYSFNRYLPNVPLNNIQKIMVVLPFSNVAKVRNLFIQKFGDYCYCSSGKKFIEFIDNRINKFFALQQISDIIQVPIQEFAAIGNEQNDILSLENVGFGIGVDFDKKHLYVDMNKIGYFVSNQDENAVALAIEEMDRRQYF